MKINWLEKYRQVQAGKNGLKESLPQRTNHLNPLAKKDDDQIRRKIEIIRKAGGVFREDGMSFHGRMPETPDEVQNQLKLSQEAWEAYLDIKPLILKEIDLFQLNGVMVRARLFNGKISVIDPDQFSEEDRILVDETIREFGLCEADFGIVGGMI